MNDVFGVAVWLAYLLALILGFVFAIRHRRELRGLLPISALASVCASGLIPETGWSDIRSQWHGALGFAIWSVVVLVLAFFVHREQSKLDFALCLALVITAMLTFVLTVTHLTTSWDFLHSM